ncbi:11-beta-hydroxysteroid dehydrogenase-like 4A [Macadamia integrifolia]|uniref:11-beta-hydroxysteroid dehydrogenase-like 4A n=1 Tax=Macadamia integrifolia TaxID=60698 RepID=UPI001C4F2794|nr:11-beta-hydroxysteroid dehydrogenase-like 4A [Macadamia integrifolia]
MGLIQNLLNLVIPPITVVFIFLILPFLSFFKFIHFILRHLFPEKMRGKVVLITGGASGIGEHLAYEYAKKGAYLVLVDKREERLGKVAEKAGQLGSPDVLVVAADVSLVDQCKRFIDEAVNHFGRLDHLVCNAGIGSSCTFQDMPDVTKFLPVMNVNFWGSIYPTYFAIPHLKKYKGKIIVNASVAGWMITPRANVYGASKAALINFYDNLRIEVAPEISIVVVSPGFIDSELTRGKHLTKKGEVEVDEKLIKAAGGVGIPIESTGDCAKAIVTGVCRGDKYITVPWLYSMFYLLRIFCPELVEWISGSLYRTMTRD